MSLKKANLNLVWRVCGADVLLIIIGLLTASKNIDLAIYTIIVNLFSIIFFFYQIIKRNLTMKSNYFEVLLIWFVYKIVTCFATIDTEEKSILATLAILIEGIWVYRWYLIPKAINNK